MRTFFTFFLGLSIVTSLLCATNFAHPSMHEMTMDADLVFCEHCLQAQDFQSDGKVKSIKLSSLSIRHVVFFWIEEKLYEGEVFKKKFPHWYYENFLKQKASVVLRS